MIFTVAGMAKDLYLALEGADSEGTLPLTTHVRKLIAELDPSKAEHAFSALRYRPAGEPRVGAGS